MSHTFPNAPSSPEEDEEKEIYCSSRGEGQFISDLCGGVFPRDQVTTVEEKEEDVKKEFILYITSEAREDQFISDLCGGVFPRDQLTTMEGEGGGCGEGVYPLYYQ